MTELLPFAIVEIKVQGLFGYINQTLSSNRDTREHISRLAILYGENGTGKTSLLRLAFHLLSPQVDRGHKSKLAETPFKLLSVRLRNGTLFKAERPNAKNGGFLFSVKPSRKSELTHTFKVAGDGTSINPYSFSPKLQKTLFDCSSTVVFLRDDRLIEIEPNAGAPNPWAESITEVSDIVRRRRARKTRHREDDVVHYVDDSDQLGVALKNAIARLDRWFTVQYSQRTSTGLASTHGIYEQVIERVVSAHGPRPTSTSMKSHIENLLKLSEESQVFETYGLSSSMKVESIIESLQNAKQNQMGVLEALLTPYIGTVEARFAALREMYHTIDAFVTQTNNFMSPKRVTYRIGEGLKVQSPHDQQLKPTELSSGERHLLLILCSAVLAQHNRTLFIIDEPEISLNTTWQRDLVGALLSVSKKSECQFIMASHSLSLISNYQDHVLRLQPEERKAP